MSAKEEEKMLAAPQEVGESVVKKKGRKKGRKKVKVNPIAAIDALGPETHLSRTVIVMRDKVRELIERAHSESKGWNSDVGREISTLGVGQAGFKMLKKQRRLWGDVKLLNFDEGRPSLVSDWELYMLAVKIWQANYKGDELNGPDLLSAYHTARDNSERRRRQLLSAQKLQKRGDFKTADFADNSP
jgi:hypothetical protein